ncbi:MAG: TfoX/Sxy family protein [Fimbriimonadaceae bacterium]|nr:TfoX/Sxy family protein [Fimbriimonadaceae bacterium]
MADHTAVEKYAALCTALGEIRWRAMFGGHCLYCDGLVFAIVDDGKLWIKVDAENARAFDEAGAAPFTYPLKDGTLQEMRYRLCPDTSSAEAVEPWASLGVDAARRAAARKGKKKPKK